MAASSRCPAIPPARLPDFDPAPTLRPVKAPLAFLLALLTVLPASAAALEQSVLQLFEQRCASCHYEGERNGRKGKKPLLTAATSLTALRRDESYILAGKPADSPLFRLVVLPEDHEDRMPQTRKPKGDPDYVPPLTAAEVAVLRQWIEAGGTAGDAGRRFTSDLDLLRLLAADLEKLPEADRADTRYLTLHNLRNLPAAVEPENDLEIYRAALAKLLNSLSWQPGIVRPEPINPERTVFRVKLSAYGWNPEMWHKLSAVYPYGLTRLGLDEWKVARLMGTDDAPFLRAD